MSGQFSLSETAYSKNPITDQKGVALKFLELVINGKIDEAYQRFVAPDGKHHNAYFRAGFPTLREGMKGNEAQFPNKRFEVKQVLGDGDMVATYSHIVMRPGEKGVAVVHMFRVREGKIVEMWDCGQPVTDDMPNEDGMF